MNEILYFFFNLPSRIYGKIKKTILQCRGCDFDDFRDPNFGLDIGYQYRPSRTNDFRWLMRKVDCDLLPFDQMSFFDAGFGKGAILIEAMKLGIPVVGGVELSEIMDEICRKNLKILGREKESTKLYQANAAELTEQLDDFNLFYMSNPFPEVVLKQFAQNIIDSVKRKPRKIFIVYYHATLCKTLEEAGFTLLYNHPMREWFKPQYDTYGKIFSLENNSAECKCN
jgi:16S rRNA G966 N2-methylase RsmD